MSEVVRAPKRRRLTDLFIRGRLESVSDDSDEEPIVVWVSKLSPLQKKEAAEGANAFKAAVLTTQKLPEDAPQKLAYYDQIELLGLNDRDRLINFIIAPEVQKLNASHEASVAAEDEWAENDYLVGLQRLWNEKLRDKYAENPEDEEALKVFKELKKFSTQVDRLVEADTEGLRRDLDHVSEDKLRARVVERLIEIESDIAWVADFRRRCVYFAVRDPDNHQELYFEDKVEVDALDDRVFNQLYDALEEISVDAMEGKD